MAELGTKIIFAGGNNKNRIGGSCSIIEHKYSKDLPPARVMFDLGSLFAPNDCLEIDAAIPDVRKYLNSKTSYAEKKLDAIFLSHPHEDHIGGYVHLARAGYELPLTYASKSTLELLKAALIEGGIDISNDTWQNKFVEIEAEKPVNIIADLGPKKTVDTGVEIEAFNMSHSTIGALGYHILTTINGKTEAGILHPGDYHLGKIRVGEGFNETKLNNLLERKIVTHAILDSTSSASDDKYLVTHEEAVNNTANVIHHHPKKQIVSAVISRSVQNLAIHLDAAKRTGRKIYLDGYWAKIAFKAMQNTGIHEFDEIVSKDHSAAEYKSKHHASQRYIITSGAFAESKKGAKSGLYKMSEQEKFRVQKEGCASKKAKAKTKKVGHPDFDIDENTLIIASQRCIEDVNGKEVRAMYARLAALGATIIANYSDNPMSNYETIKLQRSGHASKAETQKLIKLISDAQAKLGNDSVIFIPTHGNPQQLINTARAVKEAGKKFYYANNLDIIKVSKNKTSKVDELISDLWIGVGEISENSSSAKAYTYVMVDENFEIHGDPLTVVMVRRPNNKNNYIAKSQKDEIRELGKRKSRDER